MARKSVIGMLKAMPRKWDIGYNWNIFEEQFEGHQGDEIDVFITPECFLDGYAVTEEDWTVEKFAEVAQDVTKSDYIHRVQEMAHQTKTHIVFGFTELLHDHFYNCALLVGSDGEIVGKYHKTHLQNHDHRFARALTGLLDAHRDGIGVGEGSGDEEDQDHIRVVLSEEGAHRRVIVIVIGRGDQ